MRRHLRPVSVARGGDEVILRRTILMNVALTCTGGWLPRRYILGLITSFYFLNDCIHGSNEDRVQDVEGSNKLLSDHLKANGDLKSLSDIVRDLEARAQQQVQNLKEVLIEKEKALQAAQQENWSLSNKVDHLTIQLEQAKKSTDYLDTSKAVLLCLEVKLIGTGSLFLNKI